MAAERVVRMGNHHHADSGSLAATAPSAVYSQAVNPYACFDAGVSL